MKFYQMARKVREDSTLLDQQSHERIEFCTGHILIDYSNNENGEPFKGPLICTLDEEFINGKMPTFYVDPALIGTKQFYQDLTEIGIDNIEVHPALIRDEVNNRNIEDYLLLNILGRISCAVMDASEYETLGDDMNIIHKLVIDGKKAEGHDLFLVHEDTDCIVISERVYEHINSKGYTDIWFDELQLV